MNKEKSYSKERLEEELKAIKEKVERSLKEQGLLEMYRKAMIDVELIEKLKGQVEEKIEIYTTTHT